MKRRALLRWGCAHCALAGGGAWAQASSPTAPPPPGASDGWQAPPRFTRPETATDEGGLWALLDREETRLRRSPFRLRDEALQRYLGDITAKLAGEHAADIRVYALRTPFFNASMAPNGMMQVWSGLLLRVENEAQLAAVIGHEIGHYLQRHSVERLRDAKARSAFGAFMAVFGVIGLVAQMASLAGGFAFSREHEREADSIGMALMRRAGYDPREAAAVWGHLQAELAATPGADEGRGTPMFATHPGVGERRATLETMAGAGGGFLGHDELSARMAPHRFEMLEDELRRNRPDESLALLNRLLGRQPADPELLHTRGELRRLRKAEGDEVLALGDFQAAIATTRERPVTHRSLGHLLRTQGQREAARTAYRTYLDRQPQAADAALVKATIEELST
jgi:predicted Zn-dependent protease